MKLKIFLRKKDMKSRVVSMPNINEIKLDESKRKVKRGNHEELLKKELEFLQKKNASMAQRTKGKAFAQAMLLPSM